MTAWRRRVTFPRRNNLHPLQANLKASPRDRDPVHLAGLSASILPLLAIHLLKKSCCARPEPFALPAAGLPGSRGGNCFAISVLHFRASSAVTADAELVATPSATHVTASTMNVDFSFLTMFILPLTGAMRCLFSSPYQGIVVKMPEHATGEKTVFDAPGLV